MSQFDNLILIYSPQISVKFKSPLSRNLFQIDIHMNGEHVEEYKEPSVEYPAPNTSASLSSNEDTTNLQSGTHTYRLEDLAYTRSGDKGNSVNIGTILKALNFISYLAVNYPRSIQFDIFKVICS